jgi:hypothetical protein
MSTALVKLTHKERHALAELAKPVGQRDYSGVHGRTIDARGKRPLTNAQIDAHLLLDRDQQKTCKILRDLAKKEGSSFTMLEFAEIALRATGNEYARVTDEGGHQAAVCDDAHRRAAILYVYEAIKAGPPIVSETAVERGTLRDLELLARHL